MSKETMQTLIISGRLPSRNESDRAARSHWSKGAKHKETYTDLVHWFIKIGKIKPVIGKAVITFTFYESNKRRDADNIIGGGLKFILDGLVKAGIVADDSQKHVDLTINPIKHDSGNPRIEIKITGATE